VPEEAEDYNVGELIPCKFCGRKFNADRVKKHMDACAKLAKRKTKVFDMKKHRLEGVA